MEISTQQVKELRDLTGISVMQCRKALEEAGGDADKALIILRKKGADAAQKKSDRAFGAGAIGSYVHSTHEVAALVELACETDFVSKNTDFTALARDIAMHVAAQNPRYLSREEVKEEDLERAKEVFRTEIADKPAEIQEKILAGKLDSYFKEQVLLEQAYIKDADKTIADLTNSAIQKFGENIAVKRFTRFSVK